MCSIYLLIMLKMIIRGSEPGKNPPVKKMLTVNQDKTVVWWSGSWPEISRVWCWMVEPRGNSQATDSQWGKEKEKGETQGSLGANLKVYFSPLNFPGCHFPKHNVVQLIMGARCWRTFKSLLFGGSLFILNRILIEKRWKACTKPAA